VIVRRKKKSADNLFKKKDIVCFNMPAIRWKGFFYLGCCLKCSSTLTKHKKLQCINTT